VKVSDIWAFVFALIGLLCVMGALQLLDIDFSREAIAWFFLIPIGAILVAASLWHLMSRFFEDK